MNKLAINTFINKSENTLGAPQFLYHCKSSSELSEYFNNFIVQDEFDHTFFTTESSRLIIKSKNKAGQIQFCGSGVYATLYYLKNIKELNLRDLTLPSKHFAIGNVNNNIDLLISAKEVKSVDLKLPVHKIKSFYSPKNGIYLFCVDDIFHLIDDDFDKIISFLSKNYTPHGAAFFQMNHNAQGYLRYFVPWHGRNEDYVTGSIHQYLTPLVYRLYGHQHQSWTQLSSKSGRLETSLVSESQVSLSGECCLSD